MANATPEPSTDNPTIATELPLADTGAAVLTAEPVPPDTVTTAPVDEPEAIAESDPDTLAALPADTDIVTPPEDVSTVALTAASDTDAASTDDPPTTALAALAESDNVVPDLAFRACLNARLSASADMPVTAEQLDQLTGRVTCDPIFSDYDGASQGQIESIEGAQYLRHIDWLGLSHNGIVALDPLADLTNLTTLIVAIGQVNSLEPLANLVNLTFLNVLGNPISSLEPLATLSNLVTLDFSSTQVADLSPLAHLSSLETLGFSQAQVSDLSPLAGLENLVSVNASWNHVVDISVLPQSILDAPEYNYGGQGLSASGQTVTLIHNGLGEYPVPLIGWPGSDSDMIVNVTSGDATMSADGAIIRYESFGTVVFSWQHDKSGRTFTGTATVKVLPSEADNVVPDPTFRKCLNRFLGQPADAYIAASQLAALGNSAGCYADDVGSIADLEGAQYLTNLTGLYFAGHELADLTPLANLTNLTELYLTANQLTNVEAVANLTNLTTLAIGGNHITDFTPLATLVNLADLSLINGQITDLASLPHLPNLIVLYLGENQIRDLTPLAGLTNLINLELSNNQISDLTPLANLTNLTGLELSNNQISDLTPLAGLNLTGLNAFSNQIIDLTAVPSTLPDVCIGLFTGLCVEQQQEIWSIPAVGVYRVPVIQQPDTDRELRLTVQSGDATLNSDGTITYHSPGTVTLTWENTKTYADEYGNTRVESNFSGTLTVQVQGQTPEPSVPNSDSDIDETVTSTTTNGLARAADGQDPYHLTVTIHDNADQPIAGLADRLTTLIDSPDVTITPFTDNNDGTYTALVTSTTPQTLAITVQLDGQTLGVHEAQFIGITIEYPVRQPGQEQTVTGLNFRPGETVHGVLNSDPIDLGTVIAAANGSATFTTTLPNNFPLGTHTATLTGEVSGTQAITFQVTAAQTPGGTPGETPANTIAPTGANPAALTLAALAGCLLVGGGTMLTARERLRLS